MIVQILKEGGKRCFDFPCNRRTDCFDWPCDPRLIGADETMTKKTIDKYRHEASGIRPRPATVLVLVDAVEEKTAGGIILTHQFQEQQTTAAETGVVAMAGEGCLEEIGTRVTFTRYSGVIVKGADGRDYRVMKDSDIWCDIEVKK